MSNWRQSEEWLKEGKNFKVKVRHWFRPEIAGEDFFYPKKNCWNLYAYVFPKHPWFKKFDASVEYSWEQQFPFPFSTEITFCKAHRGYNGEITCWEVGIDYMHYGQDRFGTYETENDAFEVFMEGDALFNAMNEAWGED